MAVIEQDLMRSETTYQPLLTVSSEAAMRLGALMREKQLDGYALRVFVHGGGCSGFQYGMTFDNELREGDSELEAHGLPVWVDEVSARYLAGATIDYVDSLMGGGFKIENPNAVASCGCGSSFRTKDDSGEASSGGGCGSCSSH
ncbi:MAG: iron-sulfur cluster insertion protein ErpA [Chloroflexaceae bacterium]|jgi:iron-sulfur cluster assembly accessory protein|nr:iron-sulfur cluster insertion protein ErpA [Chloroflexaceae bacterium]